jgi:hypothetical protein
MEMKLTLSERLKKKLCDKRRETYLPPKVPEPIEPPKLAKKKVKKDG